MKRLSVSTHLGHDQKSDERSLIGSYRFVFIYNAKPQSEHSTHCQKYCHLLSEYTAWAVIYFIFMLSPGKRCKSRNSRTAQLPRRFCTAMHFSAVISWQLPAMFQFVSVLNRAVSKRLECLRSSLRTRSFSLRAGIAYADAYAFLRTPGFFLCEVLIATLLLQIYVYKRYFFDVALKGYESPKLERQKWCWNVNTLSIDSYTNQEVMEMSLLSLARKNLIQRKYQVWFAPMFISWYIIIMALGIAEVHNS